MVKLVIVKIMTILKSSDLFWGCKLLLLHIFWIYVWCKWFSSAKMCLNHTRTLHTDSPCPQWYLQATITILWLSSWSEQVYRRLREFWKRCETLIKKIINATKKNISRPTTKAVSHQLLVNQLTDGQQVFLGAVLHSYQKSAKWYHLPPLTLLSHSDFGIIVHLNLYFIVFHHIDGTTC